MKSGALASRRPSHHVVVFVQAGVDRSATDPERGLNVGNPVACRVAPDDLNVDLRTESWSMWPTIVCLHKRRRPSAIAGLVCGRRIDPVQGHAGWPVPHIFQKALERANAAAVALRAPTITNGDSERTVIPPRNVVPVVAPVVHAPPTVVGTGAGSTMFRVPAPCCTRSTLRRFSSTECGEPQRPFAAAFAAHEGSMPRRLVRKGPAHTQHRPLAEARSNDLGWKAHGAR